MAASSSNQPTQETNIRVFHGPNSKTNLLTGGVPTAFSLKAQEEDTILEETKINDEVHSLRLRLFSNKDFVLRMVSSPNYHTLRRMEINCPVPTVFIFDWVSCLPNLYWLRIGSTFFGDCKEGLMKKSEKSNSVQEFILNFNMATFDALEKNQKAKIQNKLDCILGMVAACLPSLKKVDLVLPAGPALDTFLDKRADIKRGGKLTQDYVNGFITFQSVAGAGSTEKRSSRTSKAKESGNGKKIKKEPSPLHSDSELQTVQTSPRIEIVNLEESDEEGDNNATAAQGQPTPIVPTDPRTRRSPPGGYQAGGNRRNGRNSPSLLQ